MQGRGDRPPIGEMRADCQALFSSIWSSVTLPLYSALRRPIAVMIDSRAVSWPKSSMIEALRGKVDGLASRVVLTEPTGVTAVPLRVCNLVSNGWKEGVSIDLPSNHLRNPPDTPGSTDGSTVAGVICTTNPSTSRRSF